AIPVCLAQGRDRDCAYRRDRRRIADRRPGGDRREAAQRLLLRADDPDLVGIVRGVLFGGFARLWRGCGGTADRTDDGGEGMNCGIFDHCDEVSPSAAVGGEGGARQRDRWGISAREAHGDGFRTPVTRRDPTRPPSASTLPAPAARRREKAGHERRALT